MSDKDGIAKKKVLLAIYSKAQTAFLKKSFEEAGFSVVTANDGIHAVQQAAAIHPDCALVGTDLPVIDAYAFSRIIKNTDYCMAQRTIFNRLQQPIMKKNLKKII